MGPSLIIPTQSPVPRSNPRIAALGDAFLMAWEELTSTGLVLRAGHFIDGQSNVTQFPLLFITQSNQFSITASGDSFLICGMDRLNAPDNYPYPRQY